MNKIGLGTVQLGLEYGVSNTTGLPDRKAIDEIINCCLESKIDVIDTAISYGNSQRVLGSYNLDEFKLITKLPNAPIEKKNLNYWVKASVEESLRELNISRLYGLLLHNPKDLAYDYGEQIYKALLELKNENVIKKIGVSIYSPAELDVITKKYDIDLKDIRCAFILLKRGGKIGNIVDIVPVSVGPKTLAKGIKLMNNMISSVMRGFAMKNRNSCQFCPYKDTPHCT